MFDCPPDHKPALESVKSRMGVSHSYFDGWYYLFLENKKFNVDDTVAKLQRRAQMEQQEFARYEVTEPMREKMKSGIVEVIGEDIYGNIAVLVTTCRDFPKVEEREDCKRNMDMWLSYVIRLRTKTNRCKVTWLINQDGCSLMKNTDLMFQKDMMIRISKYFPNAVHKVLLCNMSTALTFVMKPLLRQFPDSISQLVEVHSSTDIKNGVLKKHFSMDVLPRALGGSNENVDVPEHFLEFAANVEEYTVRALKALREGYSIKEWEMMDAYGVDRYGKPLSSKEPESAQVSPSPSPVGGMLYFSSPTGGSSAAQSPQMTTMDLPTKRFIDEDFSAGAVARQEQHLWSNTLRSVTELHIRVQLDSFKNCCRDLDHQCAALATQIHRNQVTSDDLNLLLLQSEKTERLIVNLLRLATASQTSRARQSRVKVLPVVQTILIPDILRTIARSESASTAGFHIESGDMDGSSAQALLENLRVAAALSNEWSHRYEAESDWLLSSIERALLIWPTSESWDRLLSAPSKIESILMNESSPFWIPADRAQVDPEGFRGRVMCSILRRKLDHAWELISKNLEEYLLAESYLAVLQYISGVRSLDVTALCIDTTSNVFLRAVERVYRSRFEQRKSFLFHLLPPQYSFEDSLPPSVDELLTGASWAAQSNQLSKLRDLVVESIAAVSEQLHIAEGSSTAKPLNLAFAAQQVLDPTAAGANSNIDPSVSNVRSNLTNALSASLNAGVNAGVSIDDLMASEKKRMCAALQSISPFYVNEFFFALSIEEQIMGNVHFRSRSSAEDWLEVNRFVALKAAPVLQRARNVVSTLCDVIDVVGESIGNMMHDAAPLGEDDGSGESESTSCATELQQLAVTLMLLLSWMLCRSREASGQLAMPEAESRPSGAARRDQELPIGVVPGWILTLQDVLASSKQMMLMI